MPKRLNLSWKPKKQKIKKMPLEILPPIILIPHTLDHYKYQQSYLHKCHSYYPQISEPKKKLSLFLSLSLSLKLCFFQWRFGKR